MNKAVLLVSLGMAAAAAASSAQAESLGPGEERFKLMAGWFLPAFDTDVRIDDQGLEGDEINLGDDLGLDEDQSGAILGFQWRIAPRHRLGINYSSFTQTATRVLDREITIDDEVYPIDAEVRTEWKIELIPITYSYSFIQSEKNELAGTFGVHWDRLSLKLRGSTSLSDEDLNADTDSTADLPLPLLGLSYDHHFSDKWSSGISAAYFSVEFGEDELDTTGSLYSIRAYTEYRFGGRYGAGLAVDMLNFNIEADKSNLSGEYKYDYWGPVLYLIARF